MYELLIKWGLENLGKFTSIKGSHDLSLIQEAIKTKNTIIVERYKRCWGLFENLLELALEMEQQLDDFFKTDDNDEKADCKEESVKQFIGRLKIEFHPYFYRKILKLRSSFEGTNDLISSYTYVFSELINIETFEYIIKNRRGNDSNSRSEICRLYRALWTKYCELIATLLRITTSDLRFWITDTPYVRFSDEWAELDKELAIKFFINGPWEEKRFHISLETKVGLDRFWYDLERHHEENRQKAKQKDNKDK